MNKVIKRFFFALLMMISFAAMANTLELTNLQNERKLHLAVIEKDKALSLALQQKTLNKLEAKALLATLSLRKKQLLFQLQYLKNKIELANSTLKNLDKKTETVHPLLDDKAYRGQAYWQALLLAYRQYFDVISTEISGIDALQVTLEKKLARLAKAKILNESSDEIHGLNQEIARLNEENEKILQKQTLKVKANSEKNTSIEFYGDINQSEISFNQLVIELIRVNQQFKLLDVQSSDLVPYAKISEVQEEVLILQDKLAGINNSLLWLKNYQQDKKGFLATAYKKRMMGYQAYHQLENEINQLLDKLKVRLSQLHALQKALQKTYEGLSKQLKNKVKIRQGFFASDTGSIKRLAYQLSAFPSATFKYLKTLVNLINVKFFALSWLSFLGLFVLGLLLIIFRFSGVTWLRILIEKEKRAGFSSTLFDLLLQILEKNWFSFWLCFCFFSIVFFLGINYDFVKLIAGLCLVWFVFRFSLGLSQILLLERVSDVSGQDVKLHHHLKVLLIIGGIISALTVLANGLFLAEMVEEFFNRLFMAFLLVASFVLYASRKVIPSVLPKSIRFSRLYLSKAVGIFSTILPIGIFICAFIGTIGYLNLAWVLSGYLVDGIFILAAFIIFRGILIDVMLMISEIVIRRFKNGWVLSEAFLKPLDGLLRLLIFVFFLMFTLFAYGWNSFAEFSAQLKATLAFTLIDFASLSITVKSLIEFLLLTAFFIWLVKWTHEFCYRYLFRNIRDIGIRNSLSTFTQYAVITIGAVITLRVLGVDLSGMSYILGGLAVGMGFGLRDFASNIIGGIILLIERPLREGDLVSIDAYEGRVEHIGIRSIRMRSWDNMQVLVPNSETFNKPFTNWTHQDSIVRTVVPIKIHRHDSPNEVKRLIMEVLAIVPEVLTEPEPQVLLINIDEVLYEFELRYYINIDQSQRMDVRSTVLFAISAQFIAAGIKSPIPTLQIEQHENNSQDTSPQDKSGVS